LRQISWVKRIRCNDSVQCSDNFVNEIENVFGLILKPKTMLGPHNGWINIEHIPDAHKITIFLYEKTVTAQHIIKINSVPILKDLEALL